MSENISVLISCLESYYCKWIDLEANALTLDDFYEKVDEILKNSPADDAEEWDIIDTMGLGGINHLDDIKTIYKALEIKKNCEDKNVFNGALNCCDSLDDLQSYVDNFIGFYDSETDFAEQIFNDCEECPDHLEPYIDIELYARDLFYNYEYCEKTGAVFARF
jgi:antirestriction protein